MGELMTGTALLLEESGETCQRSTKDGRFMSSVSAHVCTERKLEVGGAWW